VQRTRRSASSRKLTWEPLRSSPSFWASIIVSLEGPPLLYATRVFEVPDGTAFAPSYDLSSVRYSTQKQAMRRHHEIVAARRKTAQLP